MCTFLVIHFMRVVKCSYTLFLDLLVTKQIKEIHLILLSNKSENDVCCRGCLNRVRIKFHFVYLVTTTNSRLSLLDDSLLNVLKHSPLLVIKKIQLYIFSIIPNKTSDTNGQPMQRRPSSNLTELLQNANGSNPSSPMTSRQSSLIVRSQQNSFEFRADEEITDLDPKEIADFVTSASKTPQNGSNPESMEEDGKSANMSENKVNDESK